MIIEICSTCNRRLTKVSNLKQLNYTGYCFTCEKCEYTTQFIPCVEIENTTHIEAWANVLIDGTLELFHSKELAALNIHDRVVTSCVKLNGEHSQASYKNVWEGYIRYQDGKAISQYDDLDVVTNLYTVAVHNERPEKPKKNSLNVRKFRVTTESID